MKPSSPLFALLGMPALRQFDVVLHLAVPSTFQFRVEAPSAEDFHDFIRNAREEGVAWVKVSAVHEDSGKPYVTGFDPRIILGMDLTAVADEAEAEEGPCGEDCTCFPQAAEPAQGVNPEVPGVNARPFTAEEASALDREAGAAHEPANAREALDRLFRDLKAKDEAEGRPSMPPGMLPGLLGLAILASALKPPAR